MNNEKIYINPYQIEVLELTPDRLITLMSGRKYYVLEPVEEIIQKFEAYYRRINSGSGKAKVRKTQETEE